MKTTHIEKIVEDYINKNQTQHGILIDGVWGSGKTFFWKNTLEKTIESADYNIMYISLNGISTIEKLEQQIFLQFLPKLGKDQNEILKNLTTISKNIANATSKFFFKSDLTDLIKGTSIKSFSFNNQCVCFDDLERCKIPIDELFGYLADFVEHKYLKCIFLADEKKIKDQEVNKNLKNGYDKIKEKIIGRVLVYDPEIETIVPKLISHYKSNQSFVNFLQNHESYIVEIFKEQVIKNLRIVKFYLDSVHATFPYLSKINNEYVKECLFFLAIISIEFKTGKLTSKDTNHYKQYDQIDANWYSMITSDSLNRKDKDTPREKSETEVFYEKYLMSRIGQYHFYHSLYNYVLSGFFDGNVFMSELKEREPEKLSEEVIAFRKLLNYKFRELENSEFVKLAQDVLEYSSKGVYWIYDYKQIANFYYYFSDKKLINESKKEIEKRLLKGIERASTRKEFHQHNYENLKFFKNEQPETKSIQEKIFSAHNEFQIENNSQVSQKAIHYLESEKITEIAQLFVENKFKVEFLPLLSPQEFVNALINSSNKMIFALSELFKERYDYVNPGEYLIRDGDFLKEVQSQLNEFLNASGEIQLIRLHNFRDLLSNLESSIKKIESTRKDK